MKQATRRIGGLFDNNKKHQAGSVWDKRFLAPTIDTMRGGYREPLIIEVVSYEQRNNSDRQYVRF